MPERRPSSIAGQATAEPSTAPASVRAPAAPARCQLAGAQVPLPGWYVVKAGDTLWAIAERHYGAGMRYRRIYEANRGRLKNGPDWILPCQRLYLPRQRRRGLALAQD